MTRDSYSAGPVSGRVRASAGAEKIHSALHPEKSCSVVSGRGFDSRHLHPWYAAVQLSGDALLPAVALSGPSQLNCPLRLVLRRGPRPSYLPVAGLTPVTTG